MKIKLFLVLVSCNILISNAAKKDYTYNLVQTSPESVIEDEKNYAYPGVSYQYIINIENYNGSSIGDFTILLDNGKFEDGSKTKTVFNAEPIYVNWDDTPNVSASIKISSAIPYSDSIDLKKGIGEISYYKIASLKGQTPVLYFNGDPNQSIGSKQQFTAVVNDMIYPGIKDTIFGIVSDRKVKYFEWTLPTGWNTTQGLTGTFTTLEGVKQIDVIPDYVNNGIIKVRGENDLHTGYSETSSFTADRGFFYTNYPVSITFGDISAKTFSTTLFNGISYEWSAPSGWKINGQSNSKEALNLNSISVTPAFCSIGEHSKVKVRLKKEGDISSWYDFPSYQGVPIPDISTSRTTIYQFEELAFSLDNVNLMGYNQLVGQEMAFIMLGIWDRIIKLCSRNLVRYY